MVTQQTFEQYPPFGDNATKVQPDNAKYAAGFQPSDVLPAEWENWFLNKSSQGITDLNKGLTSVEREIINVLTEYGITPNDSTTAEGSNQLKEAIIKLRPKIATCATGASTQKKDVSAAGAVLKAGDIYVITMTNANTYGDGSSTYPTMSINSGTAYPMCNADGKYLKSGAWKAGDIITVIFTGAKFNMFTQAVVDTVTDGDQNPVTGNAVHDAIESAVQALDVSSVGNSNGTKYICAISEADGKISATAASVATTYSSTGTTAISGKGVKAAIDALDVSSVGNSDGTKYISAISETDGKISATASSVATTYDSAGTTAISGKGVKAAIDALDVSSKGGSGKYIEVISQTDGKISATERSFGSVVANNSYAVTGGAVYETVSNAISSLATSTTMSSSFDFSKYYNIVPRSEYSGLLIFCRCFNTAGSGAYLLNLCPNGVQAIRIVDSDCRSFSFDSNTKILTTSAKSGFGSVASTWFTILG